MAGRTEVHSWWRKYSHLQQEVGFVFTVLEGKILQLHHLMTLLSCKSDATETPKPLRLHMGQRSETTGGGPSLMYGVTLNTKLSTCWDKKYKVSCVVFISPDQILL